jgi:ATP adenylyltransferase/5',5'''-P-1,P-4-tetraphosphate phosphorylase II
MQPCFHVTLIASVTRKALETNDLVFTETVMHKVQGFSIRITQNLTKKPPSQFTKQSSLNPFDPPQPGLFIKQLEHHSLVLNKYCISLGHVILATRTFVSQYSPLDERDSKHALKFWMI